MRWPNICSCVPLGVWADTERACVCESQWMWYSGTSTRLWQSTMAFLTHRLYPAIITAEYAHRQAHIHRWNIKIRLQYQTEYKIWLICYLLTCVCVRVCVDFQPPSCWMSWTGRRPWRRCLKRTGRMTRPSSGRCLAAPQAWPATTQVKNNKIRWSKKQTLYLSSPVIYRGGKSPLSRLVCHPSLSHITLKPRVFPLLSNRRRPHQPIIIWLT